MLARSLLTRVGAIAFAGAVAWGAPLGAQTAPAGATPLASSVRIPAGVSANGQALPAGTYTVRVTADPVAPVVGQGPDSARWVEFVQGGQVRGRELATVIAPADVKEVAKKTPPATGRAQVQTLRGADYVRLWVNHAGSQYLVHLTATAR